MSTQPISSSHIEQRPNRAGQTRAFVAGTRIRVQDIVSDHERHGLSPEQIVREYPQLSLAQVHAALAYYYDHRDVVREHLRTDDEFARESEADAALAKRPSSGMTPHHDSVPS